MIRIALPKVFPLAVVALVCSSFQSNGQTKIMYKQVWISNVFDDEYGLVLADSAIERIVGQIEVSDSLADDLTLWGFHPYYESSFGRRCLGCKRSKIVTDSLRSIFPKMNINSGGDDLLVKPPIDDQDTKVLKSIRMDFWTLESNLQLIEELHLLKQPIWIED